ncbi:hypothetical protein FA95DRAFT_1562443 [Auriscalpium vulgare]|uniref:Uncharacterized protein n=1 Tax=Auriscalpium vulgare TaxID=40419 RepID=A0ACB8RJX8_9AGAM|nr:hypothetical protein FA95DRAFT_1562443 [Auriscalpium vulgare]
MTSKSGTTITVYDIQATGTQDGTISTNVWRVRYALHIKGLAYKVEWVEYPDIAATMKTIGAPPTGMRAGQPLYTCPAICDPTTGIILSDSLQIVQYLDTQYPATPALLPASSRALQKAFLETYLPTRIRAPIIHLVVQMSAEQLSPRSAEFFRRTRESDIGVAFEEIGRKEDERQALLGKVVQAFEEVEKWKGDELFVTGEQVSFVDVTIAAHLRRLQKSISEDEWETVWKAIEPRWGGFMGSFTKWEVIRRHFT